MAKKIKTGLAIACEHIVHGAGNKPTFIGVFTGDILVASFPSSFFVSFCVEIFDIGKLPDEIEMKVFLEGEMIGGLKMNFTGLDVSLPGLAVVPAGLLNVTKPSSIEVTLEAEGYDTATPIKKRITLAPSDIV